MACRKKLMKQFAPSNQIVSQPTNAVPPILESICESVESELADPLNLVDNV